MFLYNNISYSKDYYTLEKPQRGRIQPVCENGTFMWLETENNLPLLLFQISIIYFSILTCPLMQELKLRMTRNTNVSAKSIAPGK